MKTKPIHCLLCVIVLFFVIVCGCTRTIYQPVETVRTDSISTFTEADKAEFHSLIDALEKRVNIRDSVVIRDSVIMVVNEAGTIVSKETFHDRDRNYSRDELVQKLQAKYDSLFQAQREEFNSILDKIQQIPVPVEKQLSKWEQLKQDVGGVALGLVLAIIIAAVIWLIKKFRK